MNFCFPEECEQFRRAVRTALGDHLPFARVMDGADTPGVHTDDLWVVGVASGWTRIGIAEEDGGDGGGYLELAVLAEELGRTLAPIPAFPSMFLAAPLLSLAGDADTRPEVLRAMAQGSITTCAVPLRSGTRALEIGDGRVSGSVVAPALSSAAFLLLTAGAGGDLVDLRPGPLSTQPEPFLDLTQPLERAILEDRPCVRLGPRHGNVDALVTLAMYGGLVMLAFEQLGGARKALELAVERAKERHQFGRPIGSFQAIKHRLADMASAIELAGANALFGLWALQQHTTRATSTTASDLAGCGDLREAAQTAFIDAAQTYQMVARESLHIHGGSGFTWDGGIHLFLRRSYGRAMLLGGLSHFRRSIASAVIERGGSSAGRSAHPGWLGVDDGTAISLADTEGEARFRRDARRWLASRAPGHGPVPSHTLRYDSDTVSSARAWQAAKASSGWAGLTWPAEHGGQGLSSMHQLIWDEEEAEFATPPNLFGIATRIVGPTLIRHGTIAQHARFLPAILSGEHIWCLLLSEPDAGSDLVSLTTRASFDDTTATWLLNGHKTWVSGAQGADFALALTRTSPRGRGAPGLTVFALDMRQPGISIAPIRQIAGTSHFCEVFLDDVRVPDSGRVGELDGGWSVMATSFANERLFIATRSESDASAVLTRLARLVGTLQVNGSPAAADPGVQEELGMLAVRASALRNLEYRAVSALSAAKQPGLEGSIGKLANGALVQSMATFGVEMLAGAGTIGDPASEARRQEAEWFELFLRAPAFRIGGGTDEIQRNIIAERMLGLPRS